MDNDATKQQLDYVNQSPINAVEAVLPAFRTSSIPFMTTPGS